MGMISEFKEFAMKGNLIDMAVGIIIGGAVGKMVSSLVNDVIMPPIGVLLGGVDFSDLSYVIQEAVDKTPAVAINYGSFIQTLIDFIIIAFVIFIMIKMINKMKKAEEEVAKGPSTEELLTEIRDALKK